MKKIKFLNCQIDFSKKVFRPRAETEFLVKEAMRELRIENKEFRILDIFAGTGCIGVSILKEIKDAKVDFVDISKDAIGQIKINLGLNRIEKRRYKICRSNLFEKLKGRKYDFIFANPPYVALDRISEVQKEVLKKDPLVALFAGKDGMVLINKFFKEVNGYLKPGGKIFMEFDPLQKKKIRKVLEKEEFKFVFKKDQFEKIRWAEIWGVGLTFCLFFDIL